MSFRAAILSLKCRIMQCPALAEIRSESMVSELRSLFADDFSEHDSVARKQGGVKLRG